MSSIITRESSLPKKRRSQFILILLLSTLGNYSQDKKNLDRCYLLNTCNSACSENQFDFDNYFATES